MLREIKSTQRMIRALPFAVDGTSTGVKEVSTIQTVADVSSSLNSKYFVINTALDALSYYVWINVATAGVDPAVAGKTGVPIAVSANASADTIAAAIQVALDALPGFVATVVTDTVTVTNASDGAATDLANGAGGATTGFTLAVTTAGVTSSISLGEGKFQAVLTEGSSAAGDYLITFNDPFLRLPSVSVSPLTANVTCIVSAIEVNSVRIKCFAANDGTTAKDADFHMMVMGSLSATQDGR